MTESPIFKYIYIYIYSVSESLQDAGSWCTARERVCVDTHQVGACHRLRILFALTLELEVLLVSFMSSA
jgi:hypothetical protein